MTESISDFRCPVCRARQPLQLQCRRCQADLQLVVRARQRAEYLLGALQPSGSAHPPLQKRRLETELQQLAPRLLADQA